MPMILSKFHSLLEYAIESVRTANVCMPELENYVEDEEVKDGSIDEEIK